ncbi:MAG: hypothetical protein K9W44_06935 [Candidatus Lokiarchaeota archaeon]|nr:hypothetical protein [Candidatus Harpocratesius repetitus]
MQISDKFLIVLWNLIEKEATIIKTQKIRLHEILILHWKDYDFQIPEIDDFLPDKVAFFSDLLYRKNLLHQLAQIFTQSLQAILRIVEILLIYYPESQDFKNTFSFKNNHFIVYKIASDMIGSLLPILSFCQTPIKKDLVLIGAFKSELKITGLTVDEIQEKLIRYGLQYQQAEINEVFRKIQEDSKFLSISSSLTDEGIQFWKITDEIPLSQEISNKYIKKISPLINWVVNTWRSLYNIRELHMPIPSDYPEAEGLQKVVNLASKQGFTASLEVIENLSAYYQYIADKK